MDVSQGIDSTTRGDVKGDVNNERGVVIVLLSFVTQSISELTKYSLEFVDRIY